MNQKGLVHILIVLILLAGLGATLYLSQHTQIFKPRAFETVQQDEITNLTNQLLSSKQRYDQTLSAGGRTPNSDEIRKIASQRKEALLKEATSNPQAFLDHATLADQTTTFPEEVQPYLEKKVEMQGKLTVHHADDFDKGTSTMAYQLTTANETDYLHFVKNPPSLLSGSQIRASGVGLGSNIVLKSGTAPGANTQLDVISSASLNATGQKRVVVLLVRLNQNMRPGITREQVQQTLFDSPNSVSAFLRETSFKHTSLTGDIFGWFTLNYSELPGGGFQLVSPALRILYGGTLPAGLIVTEDVMNEADSAARNERVNLDAYDYIMYIIPIGGGGEAELGGRRSIILRVNIDARVMAHELGHNLGVNHANLVTCGNKQIDNYQSCSFTEYGEAATVMGNVNVANTYHFNGPNKVAFGWIPQLRVREVTSDGIYTISLPIEVDGTGIQVIKIRKPDTNEYYYLSYKQPVGFDAAILMEYPGDRSTRTIRGVRINTWDEISVDRTNIVLAEPQVLTDNFPAFGEYEPLGDGMSFYDQINRIQITQLSHDTNSVTVEIKFSASPPTLIPVTVCTTDSDCPSGKVCQLPVCAPVDLEQTCSEAVDKVACEKRLEEKEKTRCTGKCINVRGY